MARTNRYNDEDDALDDRGTLRDGRRARLPMMLRDGYGDALVHRPGYAYTRSNFRPRARVHDGAGGKVGHRPGFVFDRDVYARDATVVEYDRYDQALVDAWKGNDREGYSACSEGAKATGDAMSVDKAYSAYDAGLREAWRTPPTGADGAPRYEDFDDDVDFDVDEDGGDDGDDNADETVARATTPSESGWPSERTYRQARRRRETDHRTVDQMIRDHETSMAAIYTAYDRELSETWRQS